MNSLATSSSGLQLTENKNLDDLKDHTLTNWRLTQDVTLRSLITPCRTKRTGESASCNADLGRPDDDDDDEMQCRSTYLKEPILTF